MGFEIERKFRVVGEPWVGAPGRRLEQGYLARSGDVAVRVRQEGAGGFLTVKGPAKGIRRVEVELPLEPADVQALLELCGDHRVTKVRYEVDVQGHTWEIDVFDGLNAGLVVAEIELDAEDEAFVRPAWLGEEVSHDLRYTNQRLAQEPWTRWDR